MALEQLVPLAGFAGSIGVVFCLWKMSKGRDCATAPVKAIPAEQSQPQADEDDNALHELFQVHRNVAMLHQRTMQSVRDAKAREERHIQSEVWSTRPKGAFVYRAFRTRVPPTAVRQVGFRTFPLS
jgi:hypothetical protein